MDVLFNEKQSPTSEDARWCYKIDQIQDNIEKTAMERLYYPNSVRMQLAVRYF